MKFKFSLLLIALPITLCGCNEENKRNLLQNADYFLHEKISDENLFLRTNLEEFANLYNSNLSFIVLFSEEGCSACQNFEPIIEKYIRKTNNLVINIDPIKNKDIIDEFGLNFFDEKNGTPNVLTPTISVVEKNDQIFKVNYQSNMKTYTAFKNLMNSKYKTSKSCYFQGKITEESPIKSKFSYIEFTSNEDFKNKLSERIMNTKNDVLLTPNSSTNILSIMTKNSAGNLEQENILNLLEETSDEDIAKYL